MSEDTQGSVKGSFRVNLTLCLCWLLGYCLSALNASSYSPKWHLEGNIKAGGGRGSCVYFCSYMLLTLEVLFGSKQQMNPTWEILSPLPGPGPLCLLRGLYPSLTGAFLPASEAAAGQCSLLRSLVPGLCFPPNVWWWQTLFLGPRSGSCFL